MKKIFFLITAILFLISGYSQSSYHDYNSNEKQSIFFDDFDNNVNNWLQKDNDKSKFQVVNGYLLLKSKDNMGRGTKKIVSLNTSKDFELECSIKIKSSATEGKGHHFFWGKSSDAEYEFAFTKSSKFKISKYSFTMPSGKRRTPYVNFTHTPHIDKYGYNKMTIRKVTSWYYFFINEKLVKKLQFMPFFGNEIGFTVGSSSTMHIDYLSVSYLEKQTSNYPPQISISEPDVSRGFKVISAKKVRVAGKAIDNDGIYEVVINGIEAILQSGGYFYADIPLAVGDNTIKVKATDTKMKTAYKNFQVNRQQAGHKVVINNSSNEKRVALIIGNSSYTGAANLGLNPINDAKDISTALKSIGFKVILKTNANLSTMNNAIREFGRQNKDADVALFYFAGHGMQVEKTNYLLPIGINIKDKNDVDFESVSVTKIQRIMETSNSNRLNLLVLDACRNNPFRTWQRGGESGLADITPPSGTLIAFATSPGSTASNGNGRNGLYTGELIKQLKVSQRIEDVFINTRVQVEKKSGGKQSPWELARLRGKYFLVK